MNILKAFYDIITGLGSYLLVPVIFFVLGLVARRGWKKASLCSMAILGSMVGIRILVNRLGSDLVTTTNSMLDQFGLAAGATNIHWSLSAAIAYTSQLLFFMIPLGIIVNILLVFTRTTRVINLDLWSYWQVAFVGALIEDLTGSFWFGFCSCLLLVILQLLLAGAFAPQVSELIGARNVTVTQSFALGFAPIAWAVNWLIDRIPAFRGKHFTLEGRHERFGILGEPAFWGLLIGILLGTVSGRGLYNSVELGVIIGGSLYVLPRLLQVLARAVSSVISPINERVAKRRLKVPLQFGVGAIVGIANPTVLLTAIIMVPVSILLGYVLPGNLVLPQGDIAMLFYMMILIVALSGSCLIRSLLTGTISVVAMLYCGTALTQLVSRAAAVVDPATYSTGLYNTLCNASNPLAFVTMECSTFGIAGIAGLGVITLGMMFLAYRKIQIENSKLAAVVRTEQEQ